MREEAHLTARDSQALPSSAPATTWALRLPSPTPGHPCPVRPCPGRSDSPAISSQPLPGPSGREGRNYQRENGRGAGGRNVYSLLEENIRTQSICYLSHRRACVPCPAGLLPQGPALGSWGLLCPVGLQYAFTGRGVFQKHAFFQMACFRLTGCLSPGCPE